MRATLRSLHTEPRCWQKQPAWQGKRKPLVLAPHPLAGRFFFQFASKRTEDAGKTELPGPSPGPRGFLPSPAATHLKICALPGNLARGGGSGFALRLLALLSRHRSCLRSSGQGTNFDVCPKPRSEGQGRMLPAAVGSPRGFEPRRVTALKEGGKALHGSGSSAAPGSRGRVPPRDENQGGPLPSPDAPQSCACSREKLSLAQPRALASPGPKPSPSPPPPPGDGLLLGTPARGGGDTRAEPCFNSRQRSEIGRRMGVRGGSKACRVLPGTGSSPGAGWAAR